jgi:hypothetical protein
MRHLVMQVEADEEHRQRLASIPCPLHSDCHAGQKATALPGTQQSRAACGMLLTCALALVSALSELHTGGGHTGDNTQRIPRPQVQRQQVHSHCTNEIGRSQRALLSATPWHVSCALADVTFVLQVTTVTRHEPRRDCLRAFATSTDRLCSCLPFNKKSTGDIPALNHSDLRTDQPHVRTINKVK